MSFTNNYYILSMSHLVGWGQLPWDKRNLHVPVLVLKARRLCGSAFYLIWIGEPDKALGVDSPYFLESSPP